MHAMVASRRTWHSSVRHRFISAYQSADLKLVLSNVIVPLQTIDLVRLRAGESKGRKGW